jgi:hypothetical protein
MKKIIKKAQKSGTDVIGGSTIKSENSVMGFPIEKVATLHPKYTLRLKEWTRIRDCLEGEETIKSKNETYLPRPEGMTGIYAKAYDSYKERAHFPLICPYALAGALGIIINKLPEFILPSQLSYLLKEATKDGRTLQQLFIDTIIEVFITGRVPLTIDIIPEVNEFRFVQYKAEDLTNWKSSFKSAVKSIAIAVLKEQQNDALDIFNSTGNEVYRVLHLEQYIDPNDGLKKQLFKISVFGETGVKGFSREIVPNYMGRVIDEIPLFMAGSINNSFNIQPIPLISVANCSVQIYRKEADLANSEFLSCNPTLVVTGAIADNNIPNVVGSSVMIVLPNEMARVAYTKTDTAALTHVKDHIKDLYEEAIRHGVSILDARKGVEAAEALRIRQETQSSTLYSIYMSVLKSIESGLKMMCKWAGISPEGVRIDGPSSLSFGIPDSALLKELVVGFGDTGIIPIEVVHRYMVSSGLLDQTVNFNDYIEMLQENKEIKEKLGLNKKELDNEDKLIDNPTKSNQDQGDQDEEDGEDSPNGSANGSAAE